MSHPTGPSLPRTLRRSESGADCAADFSLLSWNVLADWLSSGSFIHADEESLAWPNRGERILEAIRDAGGPHGWPELIALQEVDHFADLFEPRLRAEGYRGAFVAKIEGRDGCCLFWQDKRFTPRWVRPLRYLGADGGEQTQVALLALLDDRVARAPLLLATTHLKAKPGHEVVRETQARQLVETVATTVREIGEDAGVLVTCDLNDVPESLAHRAMRNPELGLKSAYAALDGGREPAWTTWKVRAVGEVKRTIDYVFHRPGALRPIARLEVPEDADVGDGRLPSWRSPSDHLSLLARFARS